MSHRNTSFKRQLLFVQGGGEGAHDDWDAKLVASLQRELGDSCEIHYPRMPQEENPSYARWAPALLQALAALSKGAVLVGHSLGATMLANVLAQQPSAATWAGIFLIAPPFVGEGGWDSEELELPRDLGARLPAVPIHLFHGTLDDTVPAEHIELYARAIPQAKVHTLAGRDHQLNDDLREVAQAIISLG